MKEKNNLLWIVGGGILIFFLINAQNDKKMAEAISCVSNEPQLFTDYKTRIKSSPLIPISTSGGDNIHGGYTHFGEGSGGYYREDYPEGSIYFIPTSNYCPVGNDEFLASLLEGIKYDAENHLNSLTIYNNNFNVVAYKSNLYSESQIHFCSNDNTVHLYITGSNPTELFNSYMSEMYSCPDTRVEPKSDNTMIFIVIGSIALFIIIMVMRKKK